MPDPEVRFDEMITALKGSDFRMTPQRVELVRLIASSEGHPSAAQLYARFAGSSLPSARPRYIKRWRC